jgi:hypothetical protein
MDKLYILLFNIHLYNTIISNNNFILFFIKILFK